MQPGFTRRGVLKGLGTAAGALAVGPRIVSAERIEGRYIVNTDTVSQRDLRGNSDITVVHDLDQELGFVVARAPDRAMQRMGPNAEYARDLRIERVVPQEKSGPTVDEVSTAANDGPPAFYPIQWDKREQGLLTVHKEYGTGEGARVGIIDDGVLGASQQFKASHPDLTDINEELSTAFVPRPQNGGDNFGAGPLADDHGTHVAGTAAGGGAGGMIGTAPDAEIVDIRVFSGFSATFGDVIRGVVYGSQVGCDALNLSLGSGPLLPVDPDGGLDEDEEAPPGLFPVPADDLAVLVKAIDAAGTFAVNNGTLPIAAAGNDGVNLDQTFDVAFDGTAGGVDFDGSAVSLPNEGDGFMSVAAAGPIGYGWPLDGGESITTDATELRTEEPAFFTNYGPDAVDVSAGGGNADIDAIGTGVSWFYDLVLSTTFQIPDDAGQNGDNGIPEDTQLGNNYTPSYGWKAGTSMATPQVTGLAALLAAADPRAGPESIRDRIESTATQVKVGLEANEDTQDDTNGETTAPGQGVSVEPVLDSGDNVALDGAFDGDEASAPDSVDLSEYDSETFRGEGHIDVRAALKGFGGGGGGSSDSGGGSGNSGSN